jgi:hypothetical protein
MAGSIPFVVLLFCGHSEQAVEYTAQGKLKEAQRSSKKLKEAQRSSNLGTRFVCLPIQFFFFPFRPAHLTMFQAFQVWY